VLLRELEGVVEVGVCGSGVCRGWRVGDGGKGMDGRGWRVGDGGKGVEGGGLDGRGWMEGVGG